MFPCENGLWGISLSVAWCWGTRSGTCRKVSAFLADSCRARANGSQCSEERGDSSKSYLFQGRSPLRLPPVGVMPGKVSGLLDCSCRKSPSATTAGQVAKRGSLIGRCQPLHQVNPNSKKKKKKLGCCVTSSSNERCQRFWTGLICGFFLCFLCRCHSICTFWRLKSE